MNFIPNTPYKPPFILRNGHLNTLYPYFFRKLDPLPFLRERIETPDNDFFDVDYLRNGNNKIVILCHGLEGSSSSQYMQGTSKLLHSQGFDIAAMNYRGCSGEMNRNAYSYHSGATADLHLLVQHLLPNYEEINLVGFSLGGNLVLKYSCDLIYPMDEKIKAVAAISVPVDLYGGIQEILKKSNRFYSTNFLKTLREKIRLKHRQFPNKINIDDLNKIKTLLDFDDYFTGPLNGFEDAKDYYSQCNSKQFLHNCQRPTLILNAKDDPFLSDSCYPDAAAKRSDFLQLLTTKYGGHIGFANFGVAHYWNERLILEFISQVRLSF